MNQNDPKMTQSHAEHDRQSGVNKRGCRPCLAGPGHLSQVPQQPKAGHIGAGGGAVPTQHGYSGACSAWAGGQSSGLGPRAPSGPSTTPPAAQAPGPCLPVQTQISHVAAAHNTWHRPPTGAPLAAATRTVALEHGVDGRLDPPPLAAAAHLRCQQRACSGGASLSRISRDEQLARQSGIWRSGLPTGCGWSKTALTLLLLAAKLTGCRLNSLSPEPCLSTVALVWANPGGG